MKHLGKTIKNYKGSNSVYERDHAFSGNPTATNRTFSLDTQRQIFGQHGLGDFRKPTIQVQHSVTEVTDFRFVEAKILKGQNGPQGLPSPHSMDDTETLVLMLEDSKAQLSLTLYYTTFNNDATIASYSKLDNNSNQEVVIHKDFSFMADFPAADYEIVTLQGAYAREKTVRRQQVEQGIFSISSNRGASGHAQTPALLLCEQGVTEDAGNVFAIQLMYSGNFEPQLFTPNLKTIQNPCLSLDPGWFLFSPNGCFLLDKKEFPLYGISVEKNTKRKETHMNSLPNHHFQNKYFYQLSLDGGPLTQYAGLIFFQE
ncbi:hypothetical protein AZJ56_04790, partial [Streptococcus pneumoniae]